MNNEYPERKQRVYGGGKKSNSRFKRGSGCYTCVICGKVTRDTGNDEGGSGLCKHCYEVSGWVNAVNDGTCTIDDIPLSHRAEVAEQL